MNSSTVAQSQGMWSEMELCSLGRAHAAFLLPEEAKMVSAVVNVLSNYCNTACFQGEYRFF